MSFLSDHELLLYISGRGGIPSIVEGVDIPTQAFGADSPIQPCSLDLTIGQIYLPPDQSVSDLSDTRSLKNYGLLPGETVVVTTKERFKLPPQMAALCFAPARFAKNGLLITNTGHIDPGYVGHLTFTLINMSKDRFDLEPKQVIASCLVFWLMPRPHSDYLGRGNEPSEPNSPPSATFLRKLSKSFLNIEKRALVAARVAIDEFYEKIAFVGLTAVLATLIAGSATLIPLVVEPIRDQDKIIGDLHIESSNLSKRLNDLEEKGNVGTSVQIQELASEVNVLRNNQSEIVRSLSENNLAAFELRLEKLEMQLRRKSSPNAQ